MNNTHIDPRIAALWFLHSRACASLLRAHGCNQHAENHEAAMDALMEILSAELGGNRLAEAIDWVSANLWSDMATGPGTRIEH